MIYLVTNQNYLFDKSLYSFISLEEGIDLIKDKEELLIAWVNFIF